MKTLKARAATLAQEWLVDPVRRFMQMESASGVVLLFATAAALVLANSRLAPNWNALLHTPIEIRIGGDGTVWNIKQIVNDLVMTSFFLLIGAEAKRELVRGELASWQRVALPAVAALGGMLVPAAIHHLFTRGTAAASGAGIPMATDVAFALAALSVVKSRVPPALSVFLLALAIFDDLGAIAVIATFYGHTPHLGAIAVVAVLGAVGYLMNRRGVHALWPYLVLGVIIWFCMLRSGVHATLAGVIVALLMPAAPKREESEVLEELRQSLEIANGRTEGRSGAVAAVERFLESTQSPLDRTLGGMQGPVSFVVVPLFAAVNAGVDLSGLRHTIATPATIGVLMGLALGKPLGVLVAVWLMHRSKLVKTLPGVTRVHWFGIGLLAGIGFTMSLFLADVSYESRPGLADAAKVGVLTASVLSALVGVAVLRYSGSRSPETVHSAQRSGS